LREYPQGTFNFLLTNGDVLFVYVDKNISKTMFLCFKMGEEATMGFIMCFDLKDEASYALILFKINGASSSASAPVCNTKTFTFHE